jgi:methanogenic corrinoid protein MtbC1
MMPAVASIGEDWESGLVTVSQEHFASQLARRFAHRLMDVYQPRTGAPPVVCVCAPGEQHEIGLLALAVELRRRARPVVYLGPSVPVEAALATAAEVRAPALVVSATLDEHLLPWNAAMPELAELPASGRPAIVWGGPAVAQPAARGLIGPLADTIDRAIEEVLKRD